MLVFVLKLGSPAFFWALGEAPCPSLLALTTQTGQGLLTWVDAELEYLQEQEEGPPPSWLDCPPEEDFAEPEPFTNISLPLREDGGDAEELPVSQETPTRPDTAPPLQPTPLASQPATLTPTPTRTAAPPVEPTAHSQSAASAVTANDAA